MNGKSLGWVWPGMLLALVLLSAGCVATVRGPGVVAYDTSQCYWSWVEDAYGGYEQLFCYAPARASYVAYYSGGAWARRYPAQYRGTRVVVTTPRVRVVRPRGVVIRPAPARVRIRVR